MTQPAKMTMVSKLRKRLHETGSLTSFILLNGLILGVLVFGILFFSLGDLKTNEARNLTRDILRGTEQSIVDVEKAVRGLGYLYASRSLQEGGEAVERIVIGDVAFQGVLWVTDNREWKFSDRVNNKKHREYNPTLGLPGYFDLFKITLRLKENEIVYLRDIDKKGNSGVAMRLRTSDGGKAVILGVIDPKDLFGNAWSTRREDIGRVVISDHETGEVLLDTLGEGEVSALTSVDVNYLLQLGNKTWDIRFDVHLPASALFMTWLPVASLALIFLIAMAAAFVAERKHRQDMALEEMSRNLEGAHNELQHKSAERDKLFLALRKSERENRAVINSVSDIIFETDETGKLVFLNETWKRITGSEAPETIGKSLFDLIEPTDSQQQMQMFEELVRGERQAYRVETSLRVQGHVRPVEIAFSMLRMAEDKSIRVVGTMTDMEKRRMAEAALRQAEQRFRGIFENSVSGIYQLSPEGKYISANQALADMFGYAHPSELMSSVTEASSQIYADKEEHARFIEKLLFEGKVTGMEFQIVRKDGKRAWIMENARVVRAPSGGIQYFEGSVWDVTERKEAEAATYHARIQAEMSSRSRMEFLANMSHELRTPLNAVIGFSEIIKDEVMGPIGVDVYKEYAKDIFESGNHLLRVISEILEVSKIETGNRELNISTFRLTKALKSCMTIMSSRVDEAGIQLNINIPDTLPELMAEELGFKQIMLNLISNGIKFTPKGGRLDINGYLSDSGEMVIDVVDNGEGMTPEEIKKAMQPFGKVDVKFSTMKAGTGLGLTIVESLVRLHGGRFELLSEKGKGTTARVTMPAERVYKLPDVNDNSIIKIVR